MAEYTMDTIKYEIKKNIRILLKYDHIANNRRANNHVRLLHGFVHSICV